MDHVEKINFISTGGLGDSFIVASKLFEREGSKKNWLHIESTNLDPAISDMMKYLRIGSYTNIDFQSQCNEDYINKYKQGRWKEYIPVSSGVDTWCPLKGKCEWALEDPFAITTHHIREDKEYDIVIQNSAGVKNNRNWRFNPTILYQLLQAKGYKVALVGTGKLYENLENPNNFVNKLTLPETLGKIASSKILLSMSGLLTYFGVAAKVNTIFTEESKTHTERYIHKLCREYSNPIEFGTIGEVKRELKKFGINL